MRRLLIIACAAVALAGCSTDNIVNGQSSLFGVGAQNKPDGTVQGVIGASLNDFTTVPLKDSKTNAALRVTGPCGDTNAVSVFSSINGNATNGGPGSLTLNVGRMLATGEAANLMAEAAIDTASKSGNVNPRDCTLTKSGVATGPAG